MANTVTIRFFLALAATKAWPIHQIDVNNAYLHGTIDEDLYMHPPRVMKKQDLDKFASLPSLYVAENKLAGNGIKS